MASTIRNHYDDLGQQIAFTSGDWWIYSHGHWRQFTDHEMQQHRCLLHEICDSHGVAYSRYYKDLNIHLETMRSFSFPMDDVNANPYVAFENGTLDVLGGVLVPHDPGHLTTRYIDTAYDPDAACEEWKGMLDRIFEDYDPKDRAKIICYVQEYFGVALLGTSGGELPRPLRKALFLCGPPKTGKSTILAVLKMIIGSKNNVSSSVHDVTRGGFGLAAFVGKEAWITEEVSGLSKLTDPTRLKCLITGESLTVDRKYKPSVEMRFSGPVAWAANTLPNIGEYSDALYSRVVIIETGRIFDEKEAKRFEGLTPDEWLLERGEVPGIVAWAHEGYKRVVGRGRYEKIDELSSQSQDWREQNDPFFAFVREHCEHDPSVQTDGVGLTYCAMGYASVQGWDKLKEKRISVEIAEAVRTLYPDLEKVRSRVNGRRAHYWRGLRIKDSGIRFLDKIADKNPGAEKARESLNIRSTFGL